MLNDKRAGTGKPGRPFFTCATSYLLPYFSIQTSAFSIPLDFLVQLLPSLRLGRGDDFAVQV